MLNDVVDRYCELAFTGMAFYAVIMPFDDMGKCSYAEIVGPLFQATRVWQLCYEILTHLREPLLGVGEEEEEFDEFLFGVRHVERSYRL